VSEYRKELLSPGGDKYVSTSARETNDLIYGSGYREVDESTSDTSEASANGDEESPASPYAYGGEVSP
jgi:hypothetical protein